MYACVWCVGFGSHLHACFKILNTQVWNGYMDTRVFVYVHTYMYAYVGKRVQNPHKHCINNITCKAFHL